MNVMIDSKLKSITHTINARMMEAINTTTALLVSSESEGQETL
jgi:hypothetical protein